MTLILRKEWETEDYSYVVRMTAETGGPKRLKCSGVEGLFSDVGVYVEELKTKKFRGCGKTNGQLFNGKIIFHLGALETKRSSKF